MTTTTKRERITVEDVAADPTNAYEVTVHGDAAIESLTIHGDEDGHGWVYVKYANGGSSAGTPKHWASYVRIIEVDDEPVTDAAPTLWIVLLNNVYISTWESAELAQSFITDELSALRNDADVDFFIGSYTQNWYGKTQTYTFSVREYAPVPF